MASLCHDLGHFPYTHALKELPLEEHDDDEYGQIEDESDTQSTIDRKHRILGIYLRFCGIVLSKPPGDGKEDRLYPRYTGQHQYGAEAYDGEIEPFGQTAIQEEIERDHQCRYAVESTSQQDEQQVRHYTARADILEWK